MTIDDLPTPCIVLNRPRLLRNIDAMATGLARHNVPLRPHMKTAKSIDVARLATAGQPGGITVSTLADGSGSRIASPRVRPMGERPVAAFTLSRPSRSISPEKSIPTTDAARPRRASASAWKTRRRARGIPSAPPPIRSRG